MTTETPETITNRPDLSQVEYRVGRYATFLESMLAALSDQSDPQIAPIAGLRTRDPADFSIALLDSWAVVLDIVTFYSERLANEAYLRTAVEQRSVTGLAALIGYKPSPGVAASAALAFTLLTAPGAPATVTIPAGTRVQSIPGPGQTAQVFETSADLTALAAWNALPAQTTQPWCLAGKEQSTWITGTSNNISVGDALLFVSAQGGAPSSTGPVEFHYVTAVTTDPVAKATQLTWEAKLSTPDFKKGAAIYVFRKKAGLYGANAPSPQTLTGPYVWRMTGWPGSQPAKGFLGPLPSDPGTAGWQYQYTSGQVTLDAVYPGLASADEGPPQWLALTITVDAATIAAIFTITAAQDTTPGLYALTSRVTTLTVSNPQVLFNGAPDPSAGTVTTDPLLAYLIPGTQVITAYLGSAQLTGAPLPLTDWTSVNSLYPPTVVRFGGFETAARFEPGQPPGMLAPVTGAAVTVVGGRRSRQDSRPGSPARGSDCRSRRRLPGPGSLSSRRRAPREALMPQPGRYS